jgi:hypothetical protein
LDILLHSILFVAQLGFLISLPLLIYIPFSLYVSYVIGFVFFNLLVCELLNRGIPKNGLKSTEDAYSRRWRRHDDEYWIFLNGICVGLVSLFFICKCKSSANHRYQKELASKQYRPTFPHIPSSNHWGA